MATKKNPSALGALRRLNELAAELEKLREVNAHLSGELAKARQQTTPPPVDTAPGILAIADAAIAQRADQRDLPGGERSMARTVAAFNAIYGTSLTEVQGWTFMQMLKVARSSAGAFNLDDHVDGAAYAALAGEAAIRAQRGAP